MEHSSSIKEREKGGERPGEAYGTVNLLGVPSFCIRSPLLLLLFPKKRVAPVRSSPAVAPSLHLSRGLPFTVSNLFVPANQFE